MERVEAVQGPSASGTSEGRYASKAAAESEPGDRTLCDRPNGLCSGVGGYGCAARRICQGSRGFSVWVGNVRTVLSRRGTEKAKRSPSCTHVAGAGIGLVLLSCSRRTQAPSALFSRLSEDRPV